MKIKEIHIQQFKRFTNLHVIALPENAKLVVLVGPNGSGKTSLFEAFNYWISPIRNPVFQPDYHGKIGYEIKGNWLDFHKRISISFHDAEFSPIASTTSDQAMKAFYFRAAYRHEPDFNPSNASLDDVLKDTKRPQLLISSELRVSDNYQRIVSKVFDIVFDETQDPTTKKVREDLIGKVREAMLEVFGDLILTSLGNPKVDGTFLFRKGASNGFRYKNLSGGEKAAFDLILDFLLKIETFDNTVFCIDEPELHLHSKLQSKLLDEIYRQTPPNCQVWIATHSIGMMRQALDLYRQKPDEVVFLDFEGQDFDNEVTLKPAVADRQFWKRLFAVAIDDLAELVAPSEVIFCEGRPETKGGRKNTTFDAEIYRRIFRKEHPQAEFIPLGSTNDLEKDMILVHDVLEKLFITMRKWKVIDRDDRSDDEIKNLNQKGIRVLLRRDLENYLWDDEILENLCNSTNQPEKLPEILNQKDTLLKDANTSQHKPLDDVKSISGPLYVVVKRILNLSQKGNTAEEFSRVTLAPLITPDTKVYDELKAAIFDISNPQVS